MITRPTGFVRTSWSQSPTTLGSYAYLPPGATPKDRVTLRANLGTRIFFAGEHTSSAHPATVHGACLSGKSAAQEIIKLKNRRLQGKGEKIVVIGAGSAGTTAAREFIDKGYTDVIILEANSYIGGRTHTLDNPPGFESIKNTSIEMGANWVHDWKGKKGARHLTKTLEEIGANPVYMDWNEGRILDEDGVNDVVDEDKMEGYFEKIIENAEKYAEAQNSDVSYETAILNSMPQNPKISQKLLNVYFKQRFTQDFGGSVSELSAWYSDDEGTDGEEALVIGGYNKLPISLAVGVEVRCNTSVSEIIWTDKESEVEIVTSAETITADRVIVCVPLPILQNRILKITPPMPPKQWKALNKLKMGVLDKVWLHFPTPFWSTKKITWDHVNKDVDNPAVFTWINMIPISGENLLMGMIAGEEAKKMEARSDEEVMVIIMRELQVFKDAGW